MSAPPVRFKVLIGRELLMFENFQFFSKSFIRNAEGPKFFQSRSDGGVSKNFWYFSLENYWIDHMGISQKFLNWLFRKFSRNYITKTFDVCLSEKN